VKSSEIKTLYKHCEYSLVSFIIKKIKRTKE
jgi:hypothetical protein